MENKSTHTLLKMYRYYKKRKRASDIILSIIGILMFIGFFLVIGTTGSLDLDTISLTQGIIQCLIGVSLMAIPAYFTKYIAPVNETANYRLKKIKKILKERKEIKEKDFGLTDEIVAKQS